MHGGLLIVAMDQPEDAQRGLEQRALRNVRALVDKLEGRQHAKDRVAPVVASSIVVSVLFAAVILLSAGALLNFFRPPRPTPKPTPPVVITQPVNPALEAYVRGCVQKIQQSARANYRPTLRYIAGQVRLTTTIRPDGEIEKVVIERSSGNPALDTAAERFVRMAAPFPAFPKEMSATTDVLHITRTFTFLKLEDQPEIH